MGYESSQLSGMVISSAVSWVRSSYGDDVFERALLRLPPEERSIFRKLVLSLGWYDVGIFDRFMDAAYEEAKKKTGEPREKFERRSMEEGGGFVLKTIYKFVLSFSEPTNTIGRLPTIFKRVYSQGEMQILENKPGRCVLQADIPSDLLNVVRRSGRYGFPYLLKLIGAQNVTYKETERKTPTGYQIVTELTYQI